MNSLGSLSEYVDLASMANILGTIKSGSIFNHCRVGFQVSSSFAKSLTLAMKTRAHSVVKVGTLVNGKFREESAEGDGALSRLEGRSSSMLAKGLGRWDVFRLGIVESSSPRVRPLDNQQDKYFVSSSKYLQLFMFYTTVAK
jgi:hypothetical protein